MLNGVLYKCCVCAAVIVCATGLLLSVNTDVYIPPSLRDCEHLLLVSEAELVANYWLNCCKKTLIRFELQQEEPKFRVGISTSKRCLVLLMLFKIIYLTDVTLAKQ